MRALMLNLRIRWNKSSLRRSFRILSRIDQRKVVLVTLLQVLLGFLDLLGVIAIGLLGTLSVSGLQSNSPGDRVYKVMAFFQLQDLDFQTQALALVTIATVLLVGRTILSIFFTRRVLFFLSQRGAKISSDLVSRLLSQSLLIVQSRTTQEMLYSVTVGVERIAIQVLATSIVWFADLSLLVLLIIGILAFDFTTGIATIVIFSVIGFFLYKFMHIRAGTLGSKTTELNIESNEKIVEVFASYRESVVRNRRNYYAKEIGKLRFMLANTTAEMSFLPYVSKYVIETTVIIGSVLIGVLQFILQDASHAISTLALFLAAGTRIAPAALRIQQGTISIKNGLGASGSTLDLIDALGNSHIDYNSDDALETTHVGFLPQIEITNVSFTYPGQFLPAISKVSFTVPFGESFAIVGPSGAGKTTLVDILLGVLTPNEGTVTISGLPPMLAIPKWPGAISYVPQDVVIAEGTIRENVALGYPREEATDELVMSALRVAHLDQFVRTLPKGLDTPVGERGAKISGGQRQRLGIARAMFTRPHLLVLDEATSSLDGATEANISAAIQSLRGSTTVVMIAHRLSTVKNADIVVYLSNGKVIKTGKFEEVRDSVPEFKLQAKLMGY
jgi:ABC-type multidrug transport system fused ATPase/permease subunit